MSRQIADLSCLLEKPGGSARSECAQLEVEVALRDARALEEEAGREVPGRSGDGGSARGRELLGKASDRITNQSGPEGSAGASDASLMTRSRTHDSMNEKSIDSRIRIRIQAVTVWGQSDRFRRLGKVNGELKRVEMTEDCGEFRVELEWRGTL
jgi:hypothetical protein